MLKYQHSYRGDPVSQISLTFQFENIHQLTEFCARCAPHKTHREVIEAADEMAAQFNEPKTPEPIRGVTHQTAVTGTPAEGAAPVSTTPKAKRGRPRKAPENAASTPATPVNVESPPSAGVAAAPSHIDARPTDAPALVAPVLAAEPTKDAALAAFKSLHDAKGMPPCLDLLKRHGATRFGEVKPEQYPRFMQDIADMLAGKDIAAAA